LAGITLNGLRLAAEFAPCGKSVRELFSVLSAIVGLTLIAALVAYFGVGARRALWSPCAGPVSR